MNEGTFEKLGKAGQRLYGPPGLLICGYPPEEHVPFAHALESIGFGGRPIIFVTDGDSGKTVGEVLALEDRSGMGEASHLPRAVIMSGFAQEEVHVLMSAYRKARLPRQLWATLTPSSENWTVERLLGALAAEAKALRTE